MGRPGEGAAGGRSSEAKVEVLLEVRRPEWAVLGRMWRPQEYGGREEVGKSAREEIGRPQRGRCGKGGGEKTEGSLRTQGGNAWEKMENQEGWLLGRSGAAQEGALEWRWEDHREGGGREGRVEGKRGTFGRQ